MNAVLCCGFRIFTTDFLPIIVYRALPHVVHKSARLLAHQLRHNKFVQNFEFYSLHFIDILAR